MGLKQLRYTPYITRAIVAIGRKSSGSMASCSKGFQRGAIWQDEEVVALIALWGEEDIQAKLEGTTRNIKVFETISNKLKDLGFESRTAVQCREKVKKLKADYRKMKAHNNRSGRNRKTSRYMDQLDLILGHRPASQSLVVFQSAQKEVNSGEESDLEVQTGKEPLDTSAGIWSYYLLYLPVKYIYSCQTHHSRLIQPEISHWRPLLTETT